MPIAGQGEGEKDHVVVSLESLLGHEYAFPDITEWARAVQEVHELSSGGTRRTAPAPGAFRDSTDFAVSRAALTASHLAP